MGPWLPTLVLAVAAMSSGAGDTHPRAAATSSHRSALFSLQNLAAVDLDGRRWTATDLRGRVILMDFWATWCAPCLADLPRLKALRERHPRSDFEILGISLDATSRRTLVSWLNRNRIDWPQVHERSGYSGETARLFGIDRLPRTLVIDRDGSVAAVDMRGERLEELVNALVGGHTRRSENPGGER